MRWWRRLVNRPPVPGLRCLWGDFDGTPACRHTADGGGIFCDRHTRFTAHVTAIHDKGEDTHP